jgi:hypothetical protein
MPSTKNNLFYNKHEVLPNRARTSNNHVSKTHLVLALKKDKGTRVVVIRHIFWDEKELRSYFASKKCFLQF